MEGQVIENKNDEEVYEYFWMFNTNNWRLWACGLCETVLFPSL